MSYSRREKSNENVASSSSEKRSKEMKFKELDSSCSAFTFAMLDVCIAAERSRGRNTDSHIERTLGFPIKCAHHSTKRTTTTTDYAPLSPANTSHRIDWI